MLGRTVRSLSTPFRFAAAAAIAVLVCHGLALGEAETLKPFWEYELPGICWDLSFSPNERFVAFSSDERMGLLELSSGKEIWTKKPTEVSRWSEDWGFFTATVTSNGTTVFAGSIDYRYVWAFSPNGKPLWWQKVRGTPQVTRLSPDETRIAVGTAQGRLYLFTLGGKRLWTSRIPNVTVPTSIDFTKDGSRICVIGYWGGVSVFRNDGFCLWSRGLSAPDGYEWHFGAMSTDGRTVAVSSSIRQSPCACLSLFGEGGRRLWARHVLDLSSPTLTPDGEMVVGCFQDHDWRRAGDPISILEYEDKPWQPGVVALTRDGQVLWQLDPGWADTSTSPDGSMLMLLGDTQEAGQELRVLFLDGSVSATYLLPAKPVELRFPLLLCESNDPDRISLFAVPCPSGRESGPAP